MTGEIFALDIGTRSVVGVVGITNGEGFKVLEAEVVEHSTRAMLDGQIHDIEAVSRVVQLVKDRLEQRLGRPLTQVAVAAAGRALRTFRGTASLEMFSLEEIKGQQVLELELAAVQQAQAALSDEGDLYYQCVGYSVVGYKLDNVPLTSLVHHRGSQIEAEVIATFLPRSVVDSLYSVLKNCNLVMRTLTLEPIAALNVVIPPNMRSLNLALVDIGAGTSDIALVSGGTIQNYAMVPLAGDEITECLCQEFVLDFNVGEQVKRSLYPPGPLAFQDVLGITHQLESSQVLGQIIPGVKSLARAIADKILTLNNLKPPSAVVLIGGGSLTPALPEQLASCLELPGQRVAVRGKEVISGLHGELSKLTGPECITPIGIAVTSLNEQALNLLHVEVNKRPVRLFSLNAGSVADALLAAGFNLRKLHGKPGLALTVTVNGELKIIKGELGVSATIRRNQQIADLTTSLQPDDRLEVTPARDGAQGKGTIKDVIPDLQEFKVRLNGSDIKVVPRISMNQSLVSPQTALVDRAEIVWEPITTVMGLLLYLEVDPPFEGEMEITVNGHKRSLRYTLGAILLNGKPVGTDSPVNDGDSLELLDEVYPRWRVRDVAPQSGPVFVDITLNGQPRSLPGPRLQLRLNGQPAYGDEPLQAGDQLEYISSQQQLIFSDLFKYLDFKPAPPPGKSRLSMQINSQPAEFTSPIGFGDSIILDWE